MRTVHRHSHPPVHPLALQPGWRPGRRPGRRLAVLVAVAALGLAGCSSSSEGGGEGGTDGGAPAVEDLGPISAKLQGIYEDFDAAAADEQQREAEEVIAACMKEQGFDYTPVEPQNTTAFSEPDPDMPMWGTVEFAEQYGYGITTQEELGYGSPDESEMPEDPNQAAVEAMSESEQTAYYAALYGEPVEPDPAADPDEPVEWDWTTAGCSGLAQHEVYDQGGMSESPVMQELSTMYEDATSDPRYTAAQQEWVTCMADAGHPYTTSDEPQQDISDRYFEEAMDPETGEVDEAAAAELRDEEIAVATADAGCREEADVDGTTAAILKEMEEEYYAAHRAEVDAFIAEQEAQQGGDDA
ncbi:hypothetical protein [Cellulomonas marina]|uniref:Uncharacterized protein n=1 Tax=Cellulomonas marina TaxID=988821 RepID=A0A1I0Y3B8_9CELL|nr:hypothetical protein [Cellulomonas marina]GIG28387.1 hypothetical protein Cma02nite_09870 [Cellulomonas marina]SFB07387.1 hypothetical protein SAMN05421867_106134 [Cellulomonas marina]